MKSACPQKGKTMKIQMRGRMLAMMAAGVVLVIALAGCNTHADKISDLLSNPNGYANKDVTVAGEVTKVYEPPLGLSALGLLNLAAYRVNDGSGQVWVLSRVGAPVVGDKVGLKGTVRPEGRIGSTTLGTVIEEKNRKIQ